jgi:signal transduction histidine kinase
VAQGAYAMSAARSSERGIRPGGMHAVAIAAAGGAALAIGLALVSSTLRYPGLFALQRATIILAPVLVGIYWRSRRPASRFGDRLIALGFLAVPVSLEATSSSWLHTVGVMAEAPLFYATFAVILAYPGGLLAGRPERSILRLLLAGYVLWYPAFWLLSPRLVGSPVAMCTGGCPANALHVASHPEFLLRWQNGLSVVSIVAAATMILIIAIRFVSGLAPNRRTLLAGSFVSVVYLLAYVVFVSINFNHPRWLGTPDTALRWTLVVAAALLPFGFLAGLAQAEIFAGQVLRTTVGQAVNHEPIGEVEATLAGAFGDPGLRLVFWIDSSARWIDSEGAEVEAPAATEPKKLTHVVRNGVPAAAILHDARLDAEPELLQAAGAAALLVFEHATLEGELRRAIRQLRESRARLVTAGDQERRKLERDIHDGAQQQLIALRIKLALAEGVAQNDPELARRLADLREEIDRALDDLRELVHGIFPTLLVDEGLLTALHAAAVRSPLEVHFAVRSVERYAPEVEAAVYYCCLEALQNATKHAGSGSVVSIELGSADGDLYFTVSDDGVGFDTERAPEGTGLANMRDRVGALDGVITVDSAPGSGTRVVGRVPALRAGVTVLSQRRAG